MLVSITCLTFWLMNGFIHLWLKKFLNNWNRLSGRTILIDSIFRSSPRFKANTWQYIENSRFVSFDMFTRLIFENACWISWLASDSTCILEAKLGKLYIERPKSGIIFISLPIATNWQLWPKYQFSHWFNIVIHRPPRYECVTENYFLISPPKHMVWVLNRTVSLRRFFWAPKTHV